MKIFITLCEVLVSSYDVNSKNKANNKRIMQPFWQENCLSNNIE